MVRAPSPIRFTVVRSVRVATSDSHTLVIDGVPFIVSKTSLTRNCPWLSVLVLRSRGQPTHLSLRELFEQIGADSSLAETLPTLDTEQVRTALSILQDVRSGPFPDPHLLIGAKVALSLLSSGILYDQHIKRHAMCYRKWFEKFFLDTLSLTIRKGLERSVGLRFPEGQPPLQVPERFKVKALDLAVAAIPFTESVMFRKFGGVFREINREYLQTVARIVEVDRRLLLEGVARRVAALEDDINLSMESLCQQMGSFLIDGAGPGPMATSD